MRALFTTASGLGEIAVLCFAGFVLFHRWKNTFAEAAAYAVVSTLMILSFLFQLAFLARAPALAAALETLLAIGAVVFLLRSGEEVRWAFRTVGLFFGQNRAAGIALLLVTGFLFTRSVAFPPGGVPWEDLWPLLGFQKHAGFFFPDAYGHRAALAPLNSKILPHLFTRFHSGWGVNIFGFLGYLSIGFATYALSRRYAWPPTAITITLVVMSLPRFIYHAATPGHEIVPAAAAVFCILALYRAVEQPNIRDLLMLILGMLFSISGDRLCLVFPAICLALSCIVLCRRHGTFMWWKMLCSHRRALLCMVPPALVFSQIWLFWYNSACCGQWIGGAGAGGFFPNTDGIQGSLANLFRYFLESAHFTQPVDGLFGHLTGFRLTDLIHGLYGMFSDPLFGNLGAAVPFSVDWKPDAGVSWFGPLAFLLIQPALFRALVKGPRRLKAVAVAMVVYVYAVTLIPAWIPGNAMYFSIFYACAGFMAAFFLPPWRFSRKGKRGLQIACALLLFYGCLGNWPPG